MGWVRGDMKPIPRRDTIDNNIVITEFRAAATNLREQFCTAGGRSADFTVVFAADFTVNSADFTADCAVN